MKKINIPVKIIFNSFALLVLFASSCGTSINVQVQHPPALNTSGIKRIAIMPFESSAANREMAQYATTAITKKIQETNYFTLVSSSEIERLRRNNQSIENYVDATFSGQIIKIDSKRETIKGTYKDKHGKTITYFDYTVNVDIEFNYSFVLARDGRLIGPVTKKKSTSASSREKFPETNELVKEAINSQIYYIKQDIIPYTTYEARYFAGESSSDKVLKTEMKTALELVKAGGYKGALDLYHGIYERHGNVAAALNAAILHELLNGTAVAANFIRQVYDETGNMKVLDYLAKLNLILKDQETLANDYSDNRNRTDRVAAFASEEIQKVLPKGAKVWIHNNAANNSITAAVADNITSDFLKKGISVVDRQNAGLIEAERKFQMSGYVSDNDFVSIGNAAGANTIVVIDISGTGAGRRLQVRVLNVEKSIPIMQSDTSDKWQI